MYSKKRLYRKLVSVVCFTVLLMVIAAGPLPADDLDSATMRGTVVDPSGGRVPDADLRIRDANRGRVYSGKANEEGQFVLAQLPPGKYQIEVNARGFRRFEQENVQLEAAQTVSLNIILEVGGPNKTVTVTGEMPVLDISKTVVGGSLSPRELELLPLYGRELLDLVFLFPGVTEEAFETRDAAKMATGRFLSDTPIEAGVFSLSGGRPFSNNLTVDGFDNNDDREARERIRYSREAIEEVQVVTNQFSSEYGRASGGRVNWRTRSGSNEFHGRTFFFFQDESLNANSFFRNAVGEARAPFQWRQAGGLLGGPLQQDRAFFLVSFERDDKPDTAEINIPLPLATNPRFPLPQPNTQLGTILFQSSASGPISGGRFIDTIATPTIRNFLAGRFDFILSEKHNLTTRFDTSRGFSLSAFTGGNRFPSTAVERGRDSQSWAVTLNSVISPRRVHQARYQYSRLIPSNLESNRMAPVAIVVNGASGFGAGGSASTFSSNRRGRRSETRHQFGDGWTWLKGRDTLKWGAEIQVVHSRDFDLFEMNGIYTFSNVADFLANQPSRFQQAVGNPEGIVHNTVLGMYFQQDIRLRPNFSLNWGIRYDLETALSGDRNNFSPRVSLAWDPFQSGKTLLRGGFGVFYNRVLLRTWGDFAGKSGLRFLDLRSIDDVIQVFPRFSTREADHFLSNLFPHVLSNSPELFAAAQPAADLRRVAPDLKIPYAEQASFGIERALGRGWTAEASYQWNRGVKLWRDHNVNAPVPPPEGLLGYLTGRTFSLRLDDTTYSKVRFDLGTNSAVPTPNGGVIQSLVTLGLNATTFISGNSSTRMARLLFEAIRPLRPNPALRGIDQLESGGSSTYQGLSVSLSRTWGEGFLIRTSYTLSKLFEDTFINTATPQDEFNWRAERSLGNTDQRHRFIFLGVFQIPRLKLTFAPVLSFSSGRPFTLGNGGSDRNLSDRATDRPNLLQPLPTRLTLTRRPGEVSSFDPKHFFALATIGTSGNLGRNVGLGPSQRRIDLAVSRNFKLTDRLHLRPQVEIFNLFNNVIFFVNGFVDINDSDFLQPRVARKPRTLQLSVRVEF